LSVMAQDFLNSYKYGWKTSYYQNTYDFKGDEEEDRQPSGIETTLSQQGEDVELSQGVNGVNGVNGSVQSEEVLDADDCDACKI